MGAFVRLLDFCKYNIVGTHKGVIASTVLSWVQKVSDYAVNWKAVLYTIGGTHRSWAKLLHKYSIPAEKSENLNKAATEYLVAGWACFWVEVWEWGSGV